MSGGASFDGPGPGGGQVGAFAPTPLGTPGAPVENAGLLSQAMYLLIQAWNTNTTAINALIQNIGKAGPVATYSFGTLPAAPAIGTLAVCLNANADTWGAPVTGVGAFKVLTWYNGSAWTVMGI